MHLVTHVQGKLCPEMNAFDALRACFSGGHSFRSAQSQGDGNYAELEPEKRGPYAGR